MTDEKKVTRIFLQKNDLTKNPKLPYFNLIKIPDEEGGDWENFGALWKSKTGNGYSGQLNDGVVLDLSGMVKFEKKSESEEKSEEPVKTED